MRRVIVLLILIVVAGGGFAWWWFGHTGNGNGPLVLYGNVDLRQVDLAFNESGRVAAVLVDEGAQVKKGEAVARLDTGLIEPQVAQAEANVAAQVAAVDKLHNGSRPEEIAQAQANVDAAKANAHNAQLNYDRLVTLQQSVGGGPSVTQSQIDSASAAKESADAQLEVTRQALILAKAGPRKEDVAAGEAQLKAAQAQLALLRQQLKDATLTAPSDGIVRSRLLEPGDMASPQSPVFSLAIMSPKWVRAYVSEPDLPKVTPGETATVTVDGVAHDFAGHVGFISPVAEFTPHAIQTTELRTSLVYEVRVLVDDPGDLLRLGMPATVHMAAGAQATGAAAGR